MSYVLTFVSSSPDYPVTEDLIPKAIEILRTYGISQTCQPVWLSKDKAIDVGISDMPPMDGFLDMRRMTDVEDIDVFAIDVDHRRKKLLVADMESTIIKNEALDDLAEYAEVQEQVAKITAKAMAGELDFNLAIRERVKLLEGLSADLLKNVYDNIKLNEGAEQMIKVMRSFGCQCILVSGGFTYFTSRIARSLGFDHDHGNQLEIRDGVITGRVLDPILDKNAKLDYLKHYMTQMRITQNNVMAIGDGANDLEMLRYASFGVGYKPKDIVAQEIPNIIKHGDFTAALYAQGYSDYHLP